MSQVLEKPVLLDETGQEIVDKLEDIKEAIGNSGEFMPLAIKVTSPPLKTTYGVGETLDLTGLVVKLIGSNGAEIDITTGCTFVPANGDVLTSQDKSIAISYHWYRDDVTFTTSQEIKIKTLLSITVSSPPSVTTYNVGDELDLSGMVVTALYDDLTTENVTQLCSFDPADGAVLEADDTTITASYIFSGVTKTVSQEITVIAIYGVEWDGSASTMMSRTDSAANFTDPISAVDNGDGSSPFDNIAPWKNIKRVAESDNVFVEIPKFYFKWTTNNGGVKLQISPNPLDGFMISPAHADRGDGKGTRDVVYVGAYPCASTNYRSLSGVTPKLNATRSTFRTSIRTLGNDIYQWDIALYWTIQMLYLVEYADWDMISKLGKRYDNSNYAIVSGATDAMIYHTGTSGSTKSAMGSIRYRYMENILGVPRAWVDGLRFNGLNVYIINNPNDFAESGGNSIGTSPVDYGYLKGYTIPNAVGFEYFLMPSQEGASSGTYVCTYWGIWSSMNRDAAFVGTNDSAFYLAGLGSSESSPNIGSRIMKLP